VEDCGSRAETFDRLAGRNPVIGRHEGQRDEIGEVDYDCYPTMLTTRRYCSLYVLMSTETLGGHTD
jgi:hypothetical protein